MTLQLTTFGKHSRKGGNQFPVLFVVLETHSITYATFILLILSQTSLFFTCLLYKCLENTMGKGEIAIDERLRNGEIAIDQQLFLFPQRFLPILRIFSDFHQI